MINFPVPYPDELIYSTIARFGVHFGITSPKQLLDEIFGDRKVVATIDLPNRLTLILGHLQDSKRDNGCNFDIDTLIYMHTLFPLYAPFVPEDRRIKCRAWLQANSKGAIHLALGIAASRVKIANYLRYCPQCIQEQISIYGEPYWKRIWQVAGVDNCPLHGSLLTAQVPNQTQHRHQFFPALPGYCPMQPQSKPLDETVIVVKQVEGLINLPQHKSANYAQWGAFYKHLAELNGSRKGKRINYVAIKERILAKWSSRWLREQRIDINGQGNDWWIGLFRKHRKSFNYLQHIVVLHSLMPDGWTIAEVLGEVNHIHFKPNIETRMPEQSQIPPGQLEKYRNIWESLVGVHGIKSARSMKPGGAVYAWLYRHDNAWFLAFNDEHGINPESQKQRVNWEARDKRIVRQLIMVKKQHVNQLHHPQKTRNWYLSQLDNHSSVEKNLPRLPLVKLFFERHCEQLADYQIRRISRAMADAQTSGQSIKQWHVLREARLSEDRITEKARDYLAKKIGVSIA